jgi:CRP-like cAMP-binding protein
MHQLTPSAGAALADRARRNRLLAALPEPELRLLLNHAERLELAPRDALYEPEKPITAVYFPTSAIVSVLSVMSDGSAVETATVGREGMVGLPVFHGLPVTAELAIIQIPGDGIRVRAADFRTLLPRSPALMQLLHRFAVVMFTLAAQNSGCNRKHSIEQRCCRWLLMVADRLERDTLDLTHEFVAQMLGVRRASVTETLGALEQRGVIDTGRGRITLRDRSALESCTCECYGVIRRSLERGLRADDADSSAASSSSGVA